MYVSNGLDVARNLLARNKEIFKVEQRAPLVAIGAYCLMPNHFHILLTEVSEGGISKFMQKLATSYSMYYNHKYKRSGSLFEGKFKSEHVTEDRYLKYLFAYIHMNPLKLSHKNWRIEGVWDKVAALKCITEYRHSSCREYLGEARDESVIISSRFFPPYFYTREAVEEELFDWITFNESVAAPT